MFLPGTVSWTSEREQNWPLSECLAELLEFACVESEGIAVPLVRLTILWAADRVHSDFEFFARLSSVHGYCVGLSGVGKKKMTIEIVGSGWSVLWCESQHASCGSVSV